MRIDKGNIHRGSLFKGCSIRKKAVVVLAFCMIFFSAPLLSRASDEPDEISVYLSLQKEGVYIPALLLEQETLYLPISDVFNFLKINNRLSPALDSVSGFILHQNDPFLIDEVQHRISYHDTSFVLRGKELIRTKTSLYLRSDVFGKVFGLECSFQFRNLAVVINTKLDLPLFKEMRQQLLRRNMNKLKGEIRPDTTIKRQYPFLRLGVADWSITHTKELSGDAGTQMNVQMGGMLAGGEAVVALNYDNKIPFAQQQQQYQWRFVNNNLWIFKQLSLGTIAAQATASIFAPVVGVQVTNTPTSRRKSFGTYILSDHTQPEWMVELYVNNVLIDYVKADASGFFTFNVPLVYGNTTVKLKFYGPSGEERSSEKEILVPFNFLPAHTLEYTLNAGFVKDSLHSPFSRAVFHYGLTNRMTVGGGIEYLSSVKTGSRMPFLYTTVKLPANALFSTEYMPGVRTKGLLTLQMPSRVHLELEYLKYTKGQRAIFTSNLEERRAALSMPFRTEHSFFLSRFAIKEVVMPGIGYDSLVKIRYSDVTKLNRTTAEIMLSAVLSRFSANLTTSGFFYSHSNTYLQSNLSVAYRLSKGIVLRPQLQYNYSEGKLLSARLEAEKTLANQGAVQFSFTRDLPMKVSTVSFGLRYNLSFLRTAFSAVRSNKTTTLVQSAGGSLLYDAATGYVNHSDRSYGGRGSLVIAPFLDMNGNGKRDPKEPTVRGLNFRIRGGRVLKGEQEGIFRIVGLEPYSNYLIELDENSLGNIFWKIKNKKISVVVEPNSFKMVEVPVAVIAEASGTVFLQNDKGQTGISRILVNFYDSTGKLAAQTMTESDGYFSYLGLTPGSYIARIDTAQLHGLALSSSPASLTFQIAGSEEGVVADGFRFVLQSLNHPFDAKIANNLHATQSGEKAMQPEIQQKERRPENSKPVTQVEQPVNGRMSRPAVEQEQKTKDGLEQQQKAGKMNMQKRDTAQLAVKGEQPAMKLPLKPVVKDSILQNQQKPAPTNSPGIKKHPGMQKKAAVVPNKIVVPANKKRLQQQQLLREADYAFRKEQKLAQKLERLIIERQRLINEQRRLLKEIYLLKMKLRRSLPNRR
ncbi:hypothetical protein [Flavisolibacter nicotianae]|uniref:hypothetical protein n=1 Tax=Flavisolibacter nicotianae TaxID=2364882 RepID=UPI000EB011F0|nr:hypothetical protein [Flavisolibacter nicotianae]